MANILGEQRTMANNVRGVRRTKRTLSYKECSLFATLEEKEVPAPSVRRPKNLRAFQKLASARTARPPVSKKSHLGHRQSSRSVRRMSCSRTSPVGCRDRFGNFGSTPGGTMGKGREPQIILKTDQRSVAHVNRQSPKSGRWRSRSARIRWADVAMFCPSVASMVHRKWFVRPEQPEWRAPDRLASAAFSAAGRGVLGAGFRLWLFGLARPSPCGGPFGSISRGAIYRVKSPVQRVHKAEIQPGVGGDPGNNRLAHKARPARVRRRICGERHRRLGSSPSYRSGPQGHRCLARAPPENTGGRR
jgi:hypothetical protein